jgi:hypothetical protein
VLVTLVEMFAEQRAELGSAVTSDCSGDIRTASHLLQTTCFAGPIQAVFASAMAEVLPVVQLQRIALVDCVHYYKMPC